MEQGAELGSNGTPPTPAVEGQPTVLHLALTDAMRFVVDPELGEDIVSLGMVRSIAVAQSAATIEVALTIAGCPLRAQIREDIERAALAVSGIDSIEVTVGVMERDERAAVMSRARRLAQDRAVATEIPMDARILGVVS